MRADNASPGSGIRLLVVDDEPAILDVLATSLRFLGYEVTEAATGRAALAAVREHAPHLVLLDVMLPDLDGFEVVRRLRQGGSEVPVVFLTARESGADVVDGLDLGADDYITKPFRLAEVAARVRAVLRRGEGRTARGVLGCADLEVDTDTYEVRRAGRRVELSPTEYRLLCHLLVNQGRVLTHEQLLEHVWDLGDGDPGVLKTYISYLRRKLDARGPSLIETRRGIGYTLRAPDTR
ncbi:response regulator transcription factor [Streptomyces sp. NBC_01498]|uniref:response regulator transcription factor n=1 Tax=Streptomyces sp. NBC_01498 TaxID=2975870 RepID=UPI002E7B323F|nr:response regulator transcription factor [Streptomyces sp. NBC_01498]WTL25680.1 response regulator transcription factor [Streptomyces sp. NBC_01498]